MTYEYGFSALSLARSDGRFDTSTLRGRVCVIHGARTTHEVANAFCWNHTVEKIQSPWTMTCQCFQSTHSIKITETKSSSAYQRQHSSTRRAIKCFVKYTSYWRSISIPANVRMFLQNHNDSHWSINLWISSLQSRCLYTKFCFFLQYPAGVLRIFSKLHNLPLTISSFRRKPWLA